MELRLSQAAFRVINKDHIGKFLIQLSFEVLHLKGTKGYVNDNFYSYKMKQKSNVPIDTRAIDRSGLDCNLTCLK